MRRSLRSSAVRLLRPCGAWVWFVMLVLAATSTAAREPAPEPFTRGLLFRVDAPGKPSSWVFGTIHSSDPRVTSLPPPVRAALTASRRLAPESLLSRDDLPDFVAAAQFDDARRLSDYLDVDERTRLRDALRGSPFTDDAFDRLKPWAAWVMLDRQRPASGAPILDELLIIEARVRRMAVVGLELADEQVAAFDTIPVASQVAMVRWALANAHRHDADREAQLEAWLARDLGQLNALAHAPATIDRTLAPHLREVTKHLGDNRNIQMAHRLFLPLRDGRVFVAVGAMHLYGRHGLLALIRAQGYRITRVY